MGGMKVQSQSQTRSNAPVNESSTPGRSFTIVGFAFAIASLIIAAIPMGIIGAVFGGIGYAKGDKLGLWAIAASIVLAFISVLAFAAIVGSD